jgi:transcriptional regulator with XRE-family HTH domain
MASDRGSELQALGRRILQARLELGARQHPPRTITQQEIGDAMGVSGASVSAWESGQKGPSRDKLLRLATILGVRAGWLVFGEDPMRYGEEPGNGHNDTKLRRA